MKHRFIIIIIIIITYYWKKFRSMWFIHFLLDIGKELANVSEINIP